MALKALLQGWKRVGSPENTSGWHLGRFCLARPATICWFTTARESISWLPVISLNGVEAMNGCWLKAVLRCSLRSSLFKFRSGVSGFGRRDICCWGVFSNVFNFGAADNSGFVVSGVLRGSCSSSWRNEFPVGRVPNVGEEWKDTIWKENIEKNNLHLL